MVEKEFDPACIVEFVKELDLLKNATRTAWTTSGRQESTAEHSWRLAMFAMALQEEFAEMDFYRIIELCLIHDLGEAFEGDIPAVMEEDRDLKLAREEKAVVRLLEPLSRITQDRLLSLWWEYNRGETEEAKIVKALDKLETIIQHNQGKNPSDFDYGFNLEYGKELAMNNVVTKSLRELIDMETRQKVQESVAPVNK